MPIDGSLGPLPQIDRADTIQRISLNALRSAAPPSLFLVRDERVEDKGVDATLELIADGAATNIRSQIQLKSTDKESQNTDGSVSCSVDVSNINYLLNGPAPVYFLWISPRNELRFAWARDEARRFDTDSPGWREQETVTLRFSAVISPDSWTAIFNRVMAEGRLHRVTHDAMSGAAATERVTVAIDLNTLSAVTPDQAYELLSRAGFNTVSSGLARLVLDHISLLPKNRRNEPRIQLVGGYASYTLCDFFAARALLGRAYAERHNLSSEDRFFLDVMLLDCDFYTGRITIETYRTRYENLEEAAPHLIRLQLSLIRVRNDHLAERDFVRRQELYTRLRLVVAEILSDSAATDALKLEARILRLYAEGTDHTCREGMMYLLMLARARMGRRAFTQSEETSRQQNEQDALRIDREHTACVEDAVKLGHPQLIAEALYTLCAYRISKLFEVVIVAQTATGKFPQLPSAFHSEIEDLLCRATNRFGEAGNEEGVLRAGLLRADYLQVVGKPDDAREQAQNLIGIATGLGIEQRVKWAQSHIDGDHKYQTIQTQAAPPDQDARIAVATDSDIEAFSQMSLALKELPAERLDNIRRMWHSRRMIALEKMNWCQFLELEEDLSHARSRRTFYSHDPNKYGLCTKLRHESQIGLCEPDIVISAFKGAFCNGCQHKSPKASPIVNVDD